MKSTLISLLISVLFIVSYTIYDAITISNELLEKNKEEELQNIKRNLKNFVDVAYSTIDSNYKNSMDKAYLEKHYGYRLQNILDITETILRSKVEEVKKGTLTLAEAKAEAVADIQKIRYDNGRGYIWINNNTLPYPKMIMHPIFPALNGQVMDDPQYNCALGKKQNLFVAFVEVSQKKGGGFVDYFWPQTIDGVTIEVPKLSYVRLFPTWNWIIGTNFYVNDAIQDGMEKSKDELRQMRYDNGIGFFWINNTNPSSPMFYMYPIAGSIENIVLKGGQLDKLGEILTSVIEICKEKGSGYIEYNWDKPNLQGIKKEVPKLSYVKLYEPLGWIIGTGIYIDDIDKTIAKKKDFFRKKIKVFIINILVAAVSFLIFMMLVHYALLKYVSNHPTVPTVKNTEKTTTAQTPKAPEAVISINDSIKFAQEISKTILAEQSKLVAFVLNLQNSKNEPAAEEMDSDVKQLTKDVYQSLKTQKNTDRE